MKLYFLSNDEQGLSRMGTFVPYGTVLNWTSFSIENYELSNLKKYVKNCIELDKDVAIFGFRSFGDTRSYIKISASDLGDLEEIKEFEEEVDVKYYKNIFRDKIRIPMSQKRYDCVVSAMKITAKVIIEEEFNKRYENLLASSTPLERETWQYQTSDDEFLNKLAQQKGTSVHDLKRSVRNKKDEFDSAVKDLYLKSQKIKQMFYDVNSIADLAILYEDYFSIPMHGEQARHCGRLYMNEDGTLYRKPVGQGFNF
jgi:hypothetical protein